VTAVEKLDEDEEEEGGFDLTKYVDTTPHTTYDEIFRENANSHFQGFPKYRVVPRPA
jgi:hypothetical protein